MKPLKQTPLYNDHVKLKAKMVDFGGWHMPVQYTGIIDEHINTRTHAGLFDVSHMGEIEIMGPDALLFLQKIVTQDVSKSKAAEQAQYSLMCYSQGGIVDDILIYKLTDTHFLLCVNASNIEKDFQWILQNKVNENVSIQNVSENYAQLALQGPKAQAILQKLTPVDLSEIKYYRYTQGKVCDISMIISRTGYTGEDGFELYLPSKQASQIWNELLKAGQDEQLKPCGLGARDTLRVEMKYPLYGHEIDENINPLDADLSWVVKLKKDDFIGKAAILKHKQAGIEQKSVGFELLEPGIARQGYDIHSMQNELIGHVTSGTLSPSLKKAIGIGFVKHQHSQVDQKIQVVIRNRSVKAKITQTPFIARKEK